MGLLESRRLERLLDRVISTRKNCKFEDLSNLLLALGFAKRETAGSHVFFKRGRIAISVPKKKPVKEHYVEQILKIAAEIHRTG